MGGQSSIRPYWRCYYPNTDAIIFVVDSTDTERLEIAKAELFAMLEEEDLKDAILLIMANKQDAKGALSSKELSEAMGLAQIRNRQWSIQETSATQGKGECRAQRRRATRVARGWLARSDLPASPLLLFCRTLRRI